MRRRTSAANSTRPGTTGSQVMWPRVRSGGPECPDIGQCLLTENFTQRDFQSLLLVFAAGGQTAEFDGVAGDIDAVANRVSLVGGMGALEKSGDVFEDAVFSEGQVLFEDEKLLVLFGEVDEDLWLQAGVNVFGQLEGGGVVIHGGDDAEVGMGFDLDAGDDAFDIAPVIQQGRERCPAFFTHAVTFVENGDAAPDHGGDEGGSHVAQTPFPFNDRGDEKIFGAGIERSLHDVDVATHAACGGISQGGFTHARLADQARAHRQIGFVDYQPGGKELPHQFFLTDPVNGQVIGMSEVEGY